MKFSFSRVSRSDVASCSDVVFSARGSRQSKDEPLDPFLVL